jgi:endonuclease YncB( thermonuclease family)
MCWPWSLRRRVARLDGSVAEFGFAGYRGYGKVMSVYDGDTLKLATYLPNMKHPVVINCRMDGYDAPELHPSRGLANRAAHVKRAEEARDYLRRFVNCVVHVHVKGFDKYGRFLVVLTDPDVAGENINQAMVRLGYGYEYHGGKKSGERDSNSRPKDD